MTLTHGPAPGAVLAALLVVVAACDGEGAEPVGAPAPTVTVTVTETESPGPVASPSPSPAATGGCERLAEIGEAMAFVVVSAPAPGEAVPSSFTVEGCANVFEASFLWELLGADGGTLDSGSGTATCGTGCVGTFSFPVSYSVQEQQVATLRVFTRSARDNSLEHLNALPVLLTP